MTYSHTLYVLSDDVVEAYNLIKDLEPTTPQVTNDHHLWPSLSFSFLRKKTGREIIACRELYHLALCTYCRPTMREKFMSRKNLHVMHAESFIIWLSARIAGLRCVRNLCRVRTLCTSKGRAAHNFDLTFDMLLRFQTTKTLSSLASHPLPSTFLAWEAGIYW